MFQLQRHPKERMLTISQYENIGNKYPVEYATTILACLSCLVVIPIYIFYWKGPVIRERSKFAQTLAADRKAHEGRRVSQMDPAHLASLA